jgi:hypothetical protein
MIWLFFAHAKIRKLSRKERDFLKWFKEMQANKVKKSNLKAYFVMPFKNFH